MARPRIGVIGIGLMGLPIAQRLAEQGYAVRVRDVDPQRVALAAPLPAADDAAALAAACDVLIVVVVDARQTDDVLFGPRGAADALRPGQTVLLCPTIGPDDTERIAAALQARGVEAIDAPMSGGPARARDGTMSLMVACPDDVFARHEPLLRTMASRLFRVGTRAGDGARTKLVNNLLAAVNLAGAAEALALAVQLGLDAARTLEVIEQSSGQSWIASDRLRRALAGDDAPRAATALLAKDAALALAAARAVGPEPVLGAAAAAVFAQACADGDAARDDACLFERAIARGR
ncbi:NAD(P)-dependent oxidoreductase [Calidifontimicrobium sp. SYSU G02091]|uniref:NAD(P)-dependent oxidoreductase n=1 Tax=Calidifontimicrobium sp. SYSU G02091 TaxID=2926421 RepID=UPI00235167F3|nr:NAD(P)-dependent oxidoreductase [Calidifontimicrobium sp. SYSU G02091]